MSDYSCYLITVLYGNGLIKCALKIKNESWMFDFPLDSNVAKEKFHKMLPLHVQSCGPVVSYEDIFEICEAKQ